MAKTISKANQSQGMLMFTLNAQQQLFAIGTLKVREIVPYMPTTQIPYSHHHVIGTVTIRDLTVPVIDMLPPLVLDLCNPTNTNRAT